MKPNNNKASKSINEILSYFFSNAPTIANITSTSIMLAICGITLGILYPELANFQLGPGVTGFLTGIGGNIFSSVIERLRERSNGEKQLSSADVEFVVKAIRDSDIEDKLRDDKFQMEIRNILTRLDVLNNLFSNVPEQSAHLIIEAISSHTEIISESITVGLQTQAAEIAALRDQVRWLTEITVKSNGQRLQPHLPHPPRQHVFICYSRKDGNVFATKLHDFLELEGIDAWIDLYDINPTDEWDEEVQVAIEDCALFLFVTTNGSIDSKLCWNELSYAYATHKEVLLVLCENISIPIPFNGLQRINFGENGIEFQRSLVMIKRLIHQLHVPQISQKRFLDQQKRAVTDIKAEITQHTQDQLEKFPATLINPLPQNVTDRFINRDVEQTRVVNLIKKGARLIGIYGRAGIGKTALACRVINDLCMDQETMWKIISLGAGSSSSTGISIEEIFSGFFQLLEGESKNIVEAIYRNPQATVARKTSVLLNELKTDNFILYLDNLEILQDPITHKLLDSNIQAFLEIAIQQGEQLQVIVTSREPLFLPAAIISHEYRVPLEDGLPIEYGVRLLRELDEDGEAGLLNAPDEILQTLVLRTRGFPRALEIIAGRLKSNPTLTIHDLLTDKTLWANDITHVLIQDAIIRLSPNALRVMEGLALFGRPVPQVALEFLLSPFLTTTTIHGVLDQLVRSYFVSYNKLTCRFALHSVDREYCYNRIPINPLNELTNNDQVYNLQFLHYRAAEYYKLLRKPHETWREFADLEPLLHEIEHRIGANDYDAAAHLLLEIDYDYLSVMGYYGLALNLHSSLIGKIQDQELQCKSYHCLARSYYDKGFLRRSIDFDKESLSIATNLRNPVLQAVCLGGLGFSYIGLGKSDKALSYFRRALKKLPVGTDLAGRAWYLNGLGLVCFDQGQYKLAIENYMQGIQIAPSDRDGQTVASMCFANAAEAMVFLGQYKQAQNYAIESINIAKNYNYTAGLSYANYFLSLANLYSVPPNLKNAKSAVEDALKYYEPILSHSARALLGIILLHENKINAARTAFDNSLREAQELLVENPSDCSALDTKGIAYCGLELCGTSKQVYHAMKSFQTARKISSNPGIVIQYYRLLDALMYVDGNDKLTPIRAYLGGFLPHLDLNQTEIAP